VVQLKALLAQEHLEQRRQQLSRHTAVVNHYGHLALPPGDPLYHIKYDRGGAIPGSFFVGGEQVLSSNARTYYPRIVWSPQSALCAACDLGALRRRYYAVMATRNPYRGLPSVDRMLADERMRAVDRRDRGDGGGAARSRCVIGGAVNPPAARLRRLA
jgi:hypothetical protein